MWRNIWLSTTTIGTIFLTVLAINLSLSLQVAVSQIIQTAEEKVNVTVYFYPAADTVQIDNMLQALNKVDGVTSIQRITAEEAYVNYQNKITNNPELQKPLDLLDENPFGESFIIKAHSTEAYGRVLDALNNPEWQPLVEGQRKHFEENRKFIAGFSEAAKRAQTVALIISTFFAVITLLLVYNTIRIAIYTQRKEISIMRLVGATNWFIRAPFLIEAVSYTVLSVLLGLLVTVTVSGFFQPSFDHYFGIGTVNLHDYFMQNLPYLVLLEVGGLAIMTLFSSFLAIRKFLKV